MRPSPTLALQGTVLALVFMAVGAAHAETTKPKTDAEVLFTGDFESGDLKGWRVSGNAPTVAASPTRSGKFALVGNLIPRVCAWVAPSTRLRASRG